MRGRRRQIWGALLAAAVGYAALAWLTGCGLAGVVRRSQDAVGASVTGAPAVEPEPEWSPELWESVRVLTAYARDVVGQVAALGADAGDAAVTAARESLDTVQAAVGAPAWRLEVPGLKASTAEGGSGTEARATAQVRAAIERARRELNDYRAAEAAWRAEVATASRQPVTRSLRLWSGPLWLYLTFGVGGVGAALLAAARWAWKWRKVALQLIPGVQAFLDRAKGTADARAAAALKTELAKATDEAVKRVVARVKAKG